MFKRFALVLLCLLCIGLTACSSDTTSDPAASGNSGTSDTQPTAKPKIEYDFKGRSIIIAAPWDWSPKPGASIGTDNYIERIEQAENEYNFTLEYLALSQSTYDSLLSSTALAGEYMADLWYAQSYALLPGYADAGLVVSPDDYDVFDFSHPKWNQGMLEYLSWKGKHYGFSTLDFEGYSFVGNGVFFNKELFESNSLTTPYEYVENGNWTWETMIDLAHQLTQDTDGDGEVDQWGIGLNDDYYSFLFSNGARMVEKTSDGKYVYAGNSNAAVEALEFFFSLWDTDICAPWQGSWEASRLYPFMEGKVGMLSAQWWVGNSHFDNMEQDYGWVPFPIGPSSDSYQLYRRDTSTVVVTLSASDPYEAFLAYELITDNNYNDDTYKDYVESKMTDDTMMELFGQAVNESWTVYDLTSCVPELESVTRAAIDTAWGKERSAKSAMDSVQAAAQSLIDDTLNR